MSHCVDGHWEVNLGPLQEQYTLNASAISPAPELPPFREAISSTQGEVVQWPFVLMKTRKKLRTP